MKYAITFSTTKVDDELSDFCTKHKIFMSVVAKGVVYDTGVPFIVVKVWHSSRKKWKAVQKASNIGFNF